MLAATLVLLMLAAFYAILLGAGAAGFLMARRPSAPPPEIPSTSVTAPPADVSSVSVAAQTPECPWMSVVVPPPEVPSVSVVVPARNEEQKILACLESILANEYPEERLEIVVVDDESTDRTREIVEDVMHSGRVRLLALGDAPDRSRAHKKRALAEGVEAARGEIIITTDADCQVPPDWIRTLVSYFDENTGMVTGPVLYRRTGSVFADLQALEYVGLVALGSGFVRLGLPHLCNSANLAYRREAFEAVRGYSGLETITTGDDMFLLHRMGYDSPWKVRACTDRSAAVETDPNETLRAFIDQRKRWASGHARYEKLRHRMTSVLCYLFYVALAAALIIPPMRTAGLAVLCIKVAAEALLLVPGTLRFGRGSLMAYLMPVQVIQIPYILAIGIAGTFGGYTWKGRDLAR